MNKVLILSDTVFNEHRNDYGRKCFQVFTKNASGLRLAHQLRRRGIDVTTLYNLLGFDYEEFVEVLNKVTENKKHSLILCLSTSFLPYEIGVIKFNDEPMHSPTVFGVNFEKIFAFCLLAKRKFNATIVVGGWLVKVSSLPSLASLRPVVDIFVSGDGTEIITKLAKPEYCLPSTAGSFWKQEGFTFYISTDIKDFTRQASSPIPTDHINTGEALSTEIASGCIFSCSFCNYSALGKRKDDFLRSYESLRDEFKFNYETFGTRVYTFTDNILNDYQPKLEMLIRVREELGIDLKWSGYVRLDTIKNKTQAQLLIDSGMVGATMGLESFHKTAGPYIGKMTNGDVLKDKLRMCREIWKDNVIITAAMIAGLPTESVEDLEKNFEFLISKEGKYLIDSHSYSRLIMFPNQGTKNEINATRMEGDPFKDYIKRDNDTWISPWGSSKTFSKMAIEFNGTQNSFFYAFNLPLQHNLDIPVEEIVRNKRSNLYIEDYRLLREARRLTKIKINEYKKRVLA